MLKKIKVAGTALPVDAKVFDGLYGTVLDSGTTYAYLPEKAFNEFKRAVIFSLHGLLSKLVVINLIVVMIHFLSSFSFLWWNHIFLSDKKASVVGAENL